MRPGSLALPHDSHDDDPTCCLHKFIKRQVWGGFRLNCGRASRSEPAAPGGLCPRDLRRQGSHTFWESARRKSDGVGVPSPKNEERAFGPLCRLSSEDVWKSPSRILQTDNQAETEGLQCPGSAVHSFWSRPSHVSPTAPTHSRSLGTDCHE